MQCDSNQGDNTGAACTQGAQELLEQQKQLLDEKTQLVDDLVKGLSSAVPNIRGNGCYNCRTSSASYLQNAGWSPAAREALKDVLK